MTKKKTAKDEQWAEAKQRCRLSAEHVRRAKEMGLNPLSLIKNIPAPKEQWKLPVRDWIDGMYEKRMEKAEQKAERKTALRAVYRVNVGHPSRKPQTAPEVDCDFIDGLEAMAGVSLDDEFVAELTAELARENEPPDEAEIEEERHLLFERQRRFVLAAEWVTRELSALPQVKRVVLFGSVANPLTEEVPRFQRFRCWRIALPHECNDVDLAVWLTCFSELRTVQKAKNRALDALAKAEGFHIAPHQVDMFLHAAADGAYTGRLCQFAACPKGKRECDHADCGRIPYLMHIEGFAMRPAALSPERSRVLFACDAVESA